MNSSNPMIFLALSFVFLLACVLCVQIIHSGKPTDNSKSVGNQIIAVFVAVWVLVNSFTFISYINKPDEASSYGKETPIMSFEEKMEVIEKKDVKKQELINEISLPKEDVSQRVLDSVNKAKEDARKNRSL